jgi:hypothetical protein
VKKKGGTIDKRAYESLVNQFQRDIHNARFIYHYELSRYHVLGINLVAPIDHYFKISRGKDAIPMGTFDHLLISMGIHLAHIHGSDNFAILTADNRLSSVLEKCRSKIHPSTVKKLKLNIAEDVTGRPFSPDIFPKCINLVTATKKQLTDMFGQWPLPYSKVPEVYRWLK